MPPRVSVIVPVRNRRQLLAECLDALSAQTYRDFEVVVVDDGSTDGSAGAAEGRTIGCRPCSVVAAGGVGAVAARCLGVQHAVGEVLAFTDSDCRPVPEWLDQAMAALDGAGGSPPADLVAGLTRPPRPLLPLERSMSSGPEGLYPTCNLVIRRSTYEACGGFDRDAGRRLGFRWSGRAQGLGFGEDTILAWQAIRRGARPAYAPGAVVEHHIFPARLSELPGRAVQGGAFPALLAEVPEIRATLLRDRWFLGSRRRVPFYVTVLMALTGRRRLALAGLAWWSLARAREVKRAGIPGWRKPLVVAAEMATDALLGSALVAGSIQSRVVVL